VPNLPFEAAVSGNPGHTRFARKSNQSTSTQAWN